MSEDLFTMDDAAFVASMLASFEAAGRPAEPAAEARVAAAVLSRFPLTPAPRR
jgi:hypothetical protein